MNAIDAMTPQELSRAAALFGTMKQLRIQLKSADESSLDRAFEAHVHNVLEKLDQRLPSLMQQNQEHGLTEEQTKQLMTVEVIMAKHGLYDAAFQQVVMLCQTIAPGFGDCVRELRATHSSLLTDLQHSFCEVANENMILSKELSVLQQDSTGMQEDVVKLQDTLLALNTENEDYKKRILELRKNLREATQEITILKEAVSTTVENKHTSASSGRDSSAMSTTPLNHTLQSFNNTYMTNTLNFEDPNSSMEQKEHLHSNTSTTANNTMKRSNSVNRMRSGQDTTSAGNNTSTRLRRSGSSGQLQSHTPTGSSGVGGSSGNIMPGEWNSSVKDASIKDDWLLPNDTTTGLSNTLRSSNSNASVSPSRSSRNITSTAQKGLGLSIVAPVNWLLLFRAEVQKALDEGRCREMTLNEVTETVQKFYQSKTIANEKALRGIGNIPMETMEQHVFRTYEHKYGLRNIAVEHTATFLRSLLHYSITDNTILVFLKIFRNELEEDFRFIQSELFTSIKDLLLMQLISRNPNKNTNFVQKLLDEKMNAFIYEEEWMEITNYLYNSNDCSTINLLLKNLSIKEREKSGFFDTTSGMKKEPISIHSNNNKIQKTNTAYIIENNNNTTTSSNSTYNKNNIKDIKKLGYSSNTLQIKLNPTTTDNNNRKNQLKLPFQLFLRTILDFQLQSHLNYLFSFIKIFRQYDIDVDGIITAKDFQDCFIMIRRVGFNDLDVSMQQQFHEPNIITVVNEVTPAEMEQFLSLIVEIDPMQSDRVTFSSAVTCLSKMKPL